MRDERPRPLVSKNEAPGLLLPGTSSVPYRVAAGTVNGARTTPAE